MNEASIRDYLAANLHVIEPDLELIQTEFQLPNPVGAGGRIDILARDRARNLVIIELKRADAAARTALHELMKYVALIKSEKGVPSSRLRCVLVSTEWRELRVPFSQLVHTSPFTLEGRILKLDESGTPATSERVKPLPDSLGLNMPETFSWLTFGTADSRDQVAERLGELFLKIGVERAFMVLMDSAKPDELQYPFSLALIVYPLSSDGAQALLVQQEFPIQLLPDDVEAEVPLEEAAQNALLSKVFCLDDVCDVHISSLENFQAERERWNFVRLVRVGRELVDDELLPNADLLEMLTGTDGRNDVQMTRAARIAHKAQLSELVHYAEILLSRYPGWWQAAATAIERAKEDPDGIVVLHAFCPDNFLVRLSLFLWEGKQTWLPSFDLVVTYNGTVERICGSVAWDGITIPNVDGVLPLHAHPLTLVFSDSDTIDAVIEGVGLLFPVQRAVNATALPAEPQGAPLEQLASSYPNELSELARRLGRVLSL